MEPLSLPISLTLNRVLNRDNVTALRSLSLVQGETYDVTLSLLSGSTPVAPAVDSFAFLIRNTAGADLVSVTGLTQSGAGYTFPLSLVSPALGATSSYKGYFSFHANGQPEIMEPFPIHITPTYGNGSATNYIASVNGLTSAVTVAGLGSVSVSQNGQTITISGAGGQATGDYAPQSALAATGSGLQAQIANLVSHTGDYYPRTNPSGYGAGGGTPSGVVFQTGNQTISGVKTFANTAVFSSGVNTDTINQKSGPIAISVNGSSLDGAVPWRTLGFEFLQSEQWYSQVTLTKVIPAGAGSPAILNVNMPGSAQDGETITIGTFDHANVTFEWDNNGSLNDPANNTSVYMGDPFSFDNLVNTINFVFAGYLTASYGNSTLTLVTTQVGSSASVGVNGTYSGASSQGASGTDGTPESGTRLAQITGAASHARKSFISQIVVSVDNTNWGNADIEIGYLEDTTFYRILWIPSGSLTAGIHGMSTFLMPSTSEITLFFQGQGAPIYARTAIGGEAGDETTGGDATIYVKGYYSSTY